MSPTAATRRIRRTRARGCIRTCEQRLFTPRAVNRRARAAARWQGGSASRRSRRSSAFPASRMSPSLSRRSRRTICSTASSPRSGLRTLVSQPALERTRIQLCSAVVRCISNTPLQKTVFPPRCWCIQRVGFFRKLALKQAVLRKPKPEATEESLAPPVPVNSVLFTAARVGQAPKEEL